MKIAPEFFALFFSLESPELLRGYVVVGLSLKQMLESIPDSTSAKIDLYHLNETGERTALVKSDANWNKVKDSFTKQYPLPLMGQVFIVSVHPTQAWLQANAASSAGWFTLGLGALVTLCFAAIISSFKKRNSSLEQLVLKRTAALSTSELRYRHLAENSPVGLFEFQLDLAGKHRITYCSDQFCDLMDAPSKDGMSDVDELYRKIHPEDFYIVVESFEQSSLRLTPLHLEFRIFAQNVYRWIELRSTPETKENGSVVWTGVCFDITARKTAEIAEADRDRLLSAVAEGTRILLSEQEPDTAITAVLEIVGKATMQDRAYNFDFVEDPKNDEVFSNQLNEWTRSGVASQIDNPDLQNIPFNKLFPRWFQHFNAGAPIRGDVRTFPDRERSILEPQSIASLLIFPVRAEGQLLGFVGFDHCDTVWNWSDAEEAILSTPATSIGAAITRHQREKELLHSRREAETANEAKSLFLANMSHELRTPLNGIIGAVELMSDSESIDEVRGYMRMIASSGDHLLHLINDILDLAKIESGKMELVCKPFSPKELLQEVVGMLQSSAEEKNLRLTMVCSDKTPPQLIGDRQRILQILANLGSNAIKFTEHGFVRLACDWITHKEQLGIELRVTDSGIGISTEKQPLLFQKFSQVESSHNRRYGGTGLGLAICRQLSQRMGGYIHATSPRSEDGYELTRAIRAAQSKVINKDIPIIALTANALQSDRDVCLQAGMNDYMAKPISSTILKQTLARYLPNWLN